MVDPKNKEEMSMKRIIQHLSFATALVATAGVQNSSVTFEAIGKPSFIKIKGEGGKVIHQLVQEKEGKFDVFEVALADLTTGIDMRDEHMKNKYLQVKDHPKAILKIPAGPGDLMQFTAEKESQGTLTLHGQTKPIKIVATKSGNKISSEFDVKLSDYGIEIPTYAGITMADKVKVRTEFEPMLDTKALPR